MKKRKIFNTLKKKFLFIAMIIIKYKIKVKFIVLF